VPDKLTVAVLGPGRLGASLALVLGKAGYKVEEIVSRDPSSRRVRSLTRALRAKSTSLLDAKLTSDLLWFCLPDSQIAPMAARLSVRGSWRGRIVFHASGALSSDELDPLRKKGASVAAVHPLMTFIGDAPPSLHGVPFGIEGDTRAVRTASAIIRRLGGEMFRISRAQKGAYHAFGGFTSPLLVALLVSAEQVAQGAGMNPSSARRRMLPILRQTLENYAKSGPAVAFTGPIVRGDTLVVRKHLAALKSTPEARRVYVALARAALRYLPLKKKNQLRRLLAET